MLREVGPFEWEVADLATPDCPVYICRVLGYGRGTRLTLEPPKHKPGTWKAELRRAEHHDASDPVVKASMLALTDGGGAAQPGGGGLGGAQGAAFEDG